LQPSPSATFTWSTPYPPSSGVDVVELQVDLEVHREGPLGLPDQAEVGVVEQDVDVRDAVLRADGEFLDQELEVVVAGERHHRCRGVGAGHAQGRGQGPAERSGLPAVDPVPRPMDVQHLGRGDLGVADGGDVPRSGAERLVPLLVHPLRCDRHVVEVGAALHPRPPLLGGVRPGRAVGQLAAFPRLPPHGDEEFQRGPRVRGDAQVGAKIRPIWVGSTSTCTKVRPAV
jgi:hypothetical protein